MPSTFAGTSALREGSIADTVASSVPNTHR